LGFGFGPDAVVVAEVTIEWQESKIRDIPEDLNYWTNVWSAEAYVLSRAIEINELTFQHCRLFN